MADLTLSADGAAVEVAKRIGNPVYVLCFAFIMLLGVMLYGVIHYGGLAVDAQIDSVRASTKAIESNAEANRKMSKAVIEIKDMQQEQITSMRKVINNQGGILESCEQGLKDHQKIMSELTKVPKKPDG